MIGASGIGRLFRIARLLTALLVALPLSGATGASTGVGGVAARPIRDFHPSEPGRTRFGDLEFLGGLVLSSPVPGFGSFSGLLGHDRGRGLVAISDEGYWIGLRLKTDDAGRPLAVEDLRVAPVLDGDGRLFAHKWEADGESLAYRPRPGGGGEIRVGFEGHHRVLAYTVDGDDPWTAFDRPGRPVPGIPTAIRSLRANRGLEGLAEAPAGTPLAGALLLLAEEPRPGEDDQPVWIVGGPRPGLMHIARRDRFAITDAAFLPGGDLLVLQRRFGLRIGLGMRLLRIPAAEIRPDRTVEGRILLDVDWNWEIDNMEGLAVDTAPDGSTIVTLVSDDNGNWFQRTVLLRFRLGDDR